MRHVFTLCLAALASPVALAQTSLDISGVPEKAPFAVSASATPTCLLVELHLGAEWHAYARDVGGGKPVTVTLAEGCAFETSGELVLPEAPEGKLVGDVRLRLPMEAITSERPFELRATLELQVCDALECLAPCSIEVSGALTPLDVLLVTPAEDEHAQRIGAWLAERGFAPTTATYADVTQAACDAADVVLADSKGFQLNGDARRQLLRFPKTKTPIVAVGFIGTELVEEHGLAMTSGYI